MLWKFNTTYKFKNNKNLGSILSPFDQIEQMFVHVGSPFDLVIQGIQDQKGFQRGQMPAQYIFSQKVPGTWLSCIGIYSWIIECMCARKCTKIKNVVFYCNNAGKYLVIQMSREHILANEWTFKSVIDLY